MADAYGSYAIEATDVSQAIDQVYKLRPAKAQFTRFAETARWFPSRK